MNFSLIIAVYNRPEELNYLLSSAKEQSYKIFEIIVVDDGSEIPSKDVIEQYSKVLNIQYFFTKNQGQGFARNFGMSKAKSDFFILVDSDCKLPPDYFENLDKAIKDEYFDVFGGPDTILGKSKNIEKAINFSMTSLISTGGTRGSKIQSKSFLPRSFNMGLHRKVFEKIGGFNFPNKAEDLDFSLRIKKAGFVVKYLDNIFVYHKKRQSLSEFFKQIFFFGQGRVHLAKTHNRAIALIYWLPLLYSVCIIYSLWNLIFNLSLHNIIFLLTLFYNVLVFSESLLKTRNLSVALLSIITVNVQHFAYALGMIKEFLERKNK